MATHRQRSVVRIDNPTSGSGYTSLTRARKLHEQGRCEFLERFVIRLLVSDSRRANNVPTATVPYTGWIPNCNPHYPLPDERTIRRDNFSQPFSQLFQSSSNVGV